MRRGLLLIICASNPFALAPHRDSWQHLIQAAAPEGEGHPLGWSWKPDDANNPRFSLKVMTDPTTCQDGSVFSLPTVRGLLKSLFDLFQQLFCYCWQGTVHLIGFGLMTGRKAEENSGNHYTADTINQDSLSGHRYISTLQRGSKHPRQHLKCVFHRFSEQRVSPQQTGVSLRHPHV